MSDLPIDAIRRIAEQDHTAARAEAAERIKNQMSIADATMKALLLANGGAMVALFTFIGNALAKAGGKPLFDAASLWTAFACFVAGLVAALLTHALAFVSQERFYHTAMLEVWRAQRVAVTGEAEEPDARETQAFRFGQRAYVVAFTLAVVSVVLFAIGCGSALRGVLIG